MRKLLYILIGLVLVGVAISLAGYRHVYEPRTRAARGGDIATASRSLERARPDTATRSAQPARRDARPAPAEPKVDSIATFATVIDVLNVLVGIVGIVLAIMGMRMQRAALAMQGARVDNRQG